MSPERDEDLLCAVSIPQSYHVLKDLLASALSSLATLTVVRHTIPLDPNLHTLLCRFAAVAQREMSLASSAQASFSPRAPST
ncbi:hypothetical protein BaRGS_00016721 [Batillaria attramentaria]|uniref:Uncharacterized protein n=1 Tax=Batillaria attramentaria TaxID=370345 RepID=A0ABD0KZ67_9CAEN